MTRSQRIAVLVLATLTLVGCGGGPTAAVDWRMVDRTLDVKIDQSGAGVPDTQGLDGITDDYDNAQGPLVRGVNGNISTKFPQDGRYEVVLDGCGSTGAVSFDWLVDTGELIRSANCELRVRLTEGPHDVALTVRDASGKSHTAPLSLVVRNLIVVGLGDSFSAGSGDSRSGLVSLDYDVVPCTRSGRAGQPRAALEMERRDPRTAVTFLHLACGGAQAEKGLLKAHNDQKPQILELSEILPPGRAVDFLSLTIGGNDIRFSEIIAQLVEQPDAPLSILDGERTHDRTQRKMQELRDRLARVAACFGDGFEGRPCEVVGPSGRDDDTRTVAAPRIPVVARNRIVQVTYPDMTSRFASANTVQICQSGAVDRPGDLLDGLLDGLVNGRPIGSGGSPILSQPEWAWADATVLQPIDPSPDDTRPVSYLYVPEDGGGPTPLPASNTLNSVIMESAARFGWTSSARWWQDSRGHGYCAPAADNFFYRSIFHPQDSGYEVKARGLLAEAERLGVIPAGR